MTYQFAPCFLHVTILVSILTQRDRSFLIQRGLAMYRCLFRCYLRNNFLFLQIFFFINRDIYMKTRPLFLKSSAAFIFDLNNTS